MSTSLCTYLCDIKYYVICWSIKRQPTYQSFSRPHHQSSRHRVLISMIILVQSQTVGNHGLSLQGNNLLCRSCSLYHLLSCPLPCAKFNIKLSTCGSQYTTSTKGLTKREVCDMSLLLDNLHISASLHLILGPCPYPPVCLTTSSLRILFIHEIPLSPHWGVISLLLSPHLHTTGTLTKCVSPEEI